MWRRESTRLPKVGQPCRRVPAASRQTAATVAPVWPASTISSHHQADTAKVQEWLGHANIATTRIHDHRKTRADDGRTFKVAYWRDEGILRLVKVEGGHDLRCAVCCVRNGSQRPDVVSEISRDGRGESAALCRAGDDDRATARRATENRPRARPGRAPWVLSMRFAIRQDQVQFARAPSRAGSPIEDPRSAPLSGSSWSLPRCQPGPHGKLDTAARGDPLCYRNGP